MKHPPLKIVVTGPESTGKTEIARHLAGIFRAEFIAEYARSFIEGLKRPYSYADVEHIARMQVNQFEEAIQRDSGMVFLDTYLVMTKIWFREVYGKMPEWIDQYLRESEIDLFLLCYYDIEWVADPVRENPGIRRKYLFEQYQEEIKLLGIPCELVRGIGPGRFDNAQKAVLKHFSNLENKMK